MKIKNLLLFCLWLCTACNPWDLWTNSPSKISEREEGLEVTFWSPKKYYDVGETIPVTITIENISKQPITLEGAGDDKPFFDAEYETGGQWVLWSEQFPEQAAHHLELMPGEKFEVAITLAPSQARGGSIQATVTIKRPEGGKSTLPFSFSVIYGGTIE